MIFLVSSRSAQLQPDGAALSLRSGRHLPPKHLTTDTLGDTESPAYSGRKRCRDQKKRLKTAMAKEAKTHLAYGIDFRLREYELKSKVAKALEDGEISPVLVKIIASSTIGLGRMLVGQIIRHLMKTAGIYGCQGYSDYGSPQPIPDGLYLSCSTQPRACRRVKSRACCAGSSLRTRRTSYGSQRQNCTRDANLKRKDLKSTSPSSNFETVQFDDTLPSQINFRLECSRMIYAGLLHALLVKKINSSASL